MLPATLLPVHFGIFADESLTQRETIIEPTLKRGSRMQITATSKGYKTWLLMNLAICLASGTKWLRYRCRRCRVLYINFELYADTAQERLRLIAKTMGVEPKATCLHILNRRQDNNQLGPFCELLKRTLDEAETVGNPYDAIILDPIYKLYVKGMQENDAGAVKELLDTISSATEVRPHPVSFIYSHHYAKGDQSRKHAKERASGSSTYQRDPDTLVSFTEHKNDGSLVVALHLREFAPLDEFVVTWQYPLMQLDSGDLRPKDVRKAPGAPEKISRNDLLPFINGHWQTRKDLVAVILGKLEVGERTIDAKIKELESVGLVERNAGRIRRLHSISTIYPDQPCNIA